MALGAWHFATRETVALAHEYGAVVSYAHTRGNYVSMACRMRLMGLTGNYDQGDSRL